MVNVVAAPIEPFINSRRFSGFMFFSSFFVCRLDGVFDICKSKFIMPFFIKRPGLVKRIIQQLK